MHLINSLLNTDPCKENQNDCFLCCDYAISHFPGTFSKSPPPKSNQMFLTLSNMTSKILPPPPHFGGGIHIMLLHVYFLQRKNHSGTISSSFLKMYLKIRKCLEATFFSHFKPLSVALKPTGKILTSENIKFSADLLLCEYFLQRRIQRWFYLIFGPKFIKKSITIFRSYSQT